MKHRYDILIVSGAALVLVIATALVQHHFFHPAGLKANAQPVVPMCGVAGTVPHGAQHAPDSCQERAIIASSEINTRENQPPELHRQLALLVTQEGYGAYLHEPFDVRNEVLAQLPQRGEAALAGYTDALRSHNERTRAGAAYMLGVAGIADPEAVKLLAARAAATQSYFERCFALDALRKLDPQRAEELFGKP